MRSAPSYADGDLGVWVVHTAHLCQLSVLEGGEGDSASAGNEQVEHRLAQAPGVGAVPQSTARHSETTRQLCWRPKLSFCACPVRRLIAICGSTHYWISGAMWSATTSRL